MPTLHLWRWTLTDRATGRRSKTRHLMTEADALALDPQAERLPNTLEVRDVPEGGLPAHRTPGDIMGSGRQQAQQAPAGA